jgi:hypothetical protein
LVEGVTGGIKLIETAKMQRTVREIRNIQTAVNMFYERNDGLPKQYETMGRYGTLTTIHPDHYLNTKGFDDRISSIYLFDNLVKQGFYKLNPSTIFDGTKSRNTVCLTEEEWQEAEKEDGDEYSCDLSDVVGGNVPSLWIPNMPRGEIGGVQGSGVILGLVLYYGGDNGMGGGRGEDWLGRNHFMKSAEHGYYFDLQPFVGYEQAKNNFPPNSIYHLDRKIDDGICNTGDIIVCVEKEGNENDCWRRECDGYDDGTKGAYRFILRFFSYP